VDGEVGNQEENEILPLLPSQEPPPHKAVFVGDLRLADFKQLLATKGVQVLALFHVFTYIVTQFIP
jgi:cleavage and polyadenylation specificity factor subunit 2